MLKPALAAALLLCSGALAAHDGNHADHPATHGTADGLKIEHVWARALPPNAPAAAVYLTISNSGEADRLLSARTPAAERAEMHSTRQEGELLKMVSEQSVEIPAGQKLVFAPGGRHLMLMGPRQPLVAGEHFELTLVFEKAGERELRVDIREQAPSHGQPGHEHAHHH